MSTFKFLFSIVFPLKTNLDLLCPHENQCFYVFTRFFFFIKGLKITNFCLTKKKYLKKSLNFNRQISNLPAIFELGLPGEYPRIKVMGSGFCSNGDWGSSYWPPWGPWPVKVHKNRILSWTRVFGLLVRYWNWIFSKSWEFLWIFLWILGGFFGTFWGILWGFFWDFFGDFLGLLWDSLGVLLEFYWEFFGNSWGILWKLWQFYWNSLESF